MADLSPGVGGCRGMQSIDSTAIEAVDYDAETLTLEVRFVSGGDYRYFDVTAETARAFRAAESKGRFFHDHIRDRFRFERRR